MTTLKGMRASFKKFYYYMMLVCCAVSYGLVILWWFGFLGGCAYDGSNIANCNLLGMNIDRIADLFLTIWIIPFVGLIIGPLSPFIIAFVLTVMYWPIYFLCSMTWNFLKEKKRNASSK